MNMAFVKIWGELAGAVAWNPETGVAAFEYNDKFKKQGWDLSPLKMPIASSGNEFSFPELKGNKNTVFNTFKGLPGLLADVLPDNYGNHLIQMWLASQGRAENSMNPVEMLCFIGSRGMGALEFEPTIIKESLQTFKVEIDSLVEIARRAFNQKDEFKTNMHDGEKAILDMLKIGTSAGGARPKAVIAYNEKSGEIKSGQTKAPKGFEHWLIKLDGVSDVQLGASSGFGSVEMAYYLMATSCGIEMMPSKLLEENGRAHFMTKRFDRDHDNTKHHVQTFCAMKHYDFTLTNSFSYEQLFQTMRELKLSYADAAQMFRRMVFNVMARNCDDHTKNFSFLLKQHGKWQLAPAYDVCHAYRPGSVWVSQHALSINGKRKEITKNDLLQIGQTIGSRKAELIIDEIAEIVNRWPAYANETGVDSKLRDQIAKTHLTL